MAPASTHQLLRLAYGELPVLERLETEYALTRDQRARRQYAELVAAQRELTRVAFSPPQGTVDAILAYSRRSLLEPTL